MEKSEVITLLGCTPIMDDRVFHGFLRGKEFLVLYMSGKSVDKMTDKYSFGTTRECPELSNPKYPIVIWWKGECKGCFKRNAPMFHDGTAYRYPMKFMMSI